MISNRNASIYCHQIATLLAAGVPLDRALMTLSRSAPSRGLRRMTVDLARRIEQGETFAGAVAAHRHRVPRLMLSFFEIGEQTGQLPEVARSLSKYYQDQWELARGTITQLLPILFYFAICAVAIVFIQYVRSGWDASVFQRTGEHVALVIAGIIFVAVAIKLVPTVRTVVVFVASSLPVLSGIMRHYAISRFALSMQVSLATGLDVRRTIELSADAMANPVLAPRVRRAAKWIDENLTIAEALERTHVFGRETISLFETGELTGRLVETMEKVAEASRFRGVTAARAAAKVFTIVIYVGMILFVAYTIISLYVQRYSGLLELIDSAGE